MRRKKTFLILGVVLVLGLITFGVFSTNSFKPVSIKAQSNQGNIFEVINHRARANSLNPDLEKSEEIARLIVENLSVLYVPDSMLRPFLEQVAVAHLNGAGSIDENNVVSAVNQLASLSGAPAYSTTNVEQVKVVRAFLHRLMPDLVSSSGMMTDLEAFAVFTATVSQKIDNPAFMVTAQKFSGNLELPVNQPFPGSAEAELTALEVNTSNEKHQEMLNVVNNYVNSANMNAATEIISTLGIQ